jgi:hypothetical protein
MMGQSSRDQGQLFYSFNFEEVVPGDHPVRAIGDVLDLSWVRTELAPPTHRNQATYTLSRSPVSSRRPDFPRVWDGNREPGVPWLQVSLAKKAAIHNHNLKREFS